MAAKFVLKLASALKFVDYPLLDHDSLNKADKREQEHVDVEEYLILDDVPQVRHILILLRKSFVLDILALQHHFLSLYPLLNGLVDQVDYPDEY